MKKDEKTKLSREKIVNHSWELFGELGYSNFSTNELCRRYGISKGLLYHNFSGKDELFLECVKICYKKIIDSIESELKNLTLEKYIDLRTALFKNDRALSRIFFESLIQRDELQREIQVIRNSLTDLNRKIYLNWIEELELRDEVTREDAARYLDFVQNMINSHYSSESLKSEDLDFLKREYEVSIHKFLEFFIYGIASKRGDV